MLINDTARGSTKGFNILSKPPTFHSGEPKGGHDTYNILQTCPQDIELAISSVEKIIEEVPRSSDP